MQLANRAKIAILSGPLLYALRFGRNLGAVEETIASPQSPWGLRFSATVVVLVGILYGPMTGIAAAPTSLDSADFAVLPVALVVEEVVREFKAVVTQYSFADSCHNIRKGRCLMASGKPVYVGAVACPMALRLGTRVVVDGVAYTCEDRYAKWLDEMRGYPTIDIFVEKNPRGRWIKTVSVLANQPL